MHFNVTLIQLKVIWMRLTITKKVLCKGALLIEEWLQKLPDQLVSGADFYVYGILLDILYHMPNITEQSFLPALAQAAFILKFLLLVYLLLGANVFPCCTFFHV